MATFDFTVHGYLLDAANCLKPYHPSPELQEEIRSALNLISTKRYRVAVIGEFKRGKSSLINSLMGMPILPMDATPTTATINRITYGLTPKVIVHYMDGQDQEASIDQLPQFVTKLTEQNRTVAATVKEAEVRYPIVLCQNNVDIIDTPGLNDETSMTSVTENLLKDVDAIIVVVSALIPYSESECRWVSRLLSIPNLSHVLFVVNFIDQIDEDEREGFIKSLRSRISRNTLSDVRTRYASEPAVLQKAERLFSIDSMEIFPVSAKSALDAFVNNNTQLLSQSNLPSFKTELLAILTAQQTVHMVEVAQQAILHAQAWILKAAKERADKYASEESKCDAALLAVDEYAQNRIRKMDRNLSLYNDSITKACNSKNPYEEMRREMIKALGAVRVNDDATIRTAIQNGTQQAKLVLGRVFGETLNNASAAAIAAAEACLSQYDTDFYALCSSYQNEESKIDSPEELRAYFMKQLEGISPPELPGGFSLIPVTNSLVGMNVIGYIETRLVQALDTLRNQWAEFPVFYRQALSGIALHTSAASLTRLKEEILRERGAALNRNQEAVAENRVNLIRMRDITAAINALAESVHSGNIPEDTQL